MGLVANVFRDFPSLEPGFAIARLGLQTQYDARFVRMCWEIPRWIQTNRWFPFNKGGDYERFYFDVQLLLFYAEDGKDLKRHALTTPGTTHWSRNIRNPELYFREGLTWPRRTQRGFNVRLMPEGCIFSEKGPCIFANSSEEAFYLLGVLNSNIAEYLLGGLTSFGSWEVGAVQRLPVPKPAHRQSHHIAELTELVRYAKASWDEGNEISTHFTKPWLLRKDILEPSSSISDRLERLTEFEAVEDVRIQKLYAELNDEVYRLYGIPDSSRQIIEETLGARPLEIIWPQMESKTTEQKRMEHVWRLLSYVVKRVVEADADGIVPFMTISGEIALLERVHQELAALFPGRDVNQVGSSALLVKQVSGGRAEYTPVLNCYVLYY